MKNVIGGFPKCFEGQSDEEALKEYLKPVKELRSRTKRGMMKCKHALVMSHGNIEVAQYYLKL